MPLSLRASQPYSLPLLACLLALPSLLALPNDYILALLDLVVIWASKDGDTSILYCKTYGRCLNLIY